MQPSSAIGIDIGGTRTRVGVVDRDGGVITRSDFRTPIDGGRSALVDRLAAHIERSHRSAAGLISRRSPIGIAVPGLVDRTSGMVTRSVNLPFLEGVSASDLLPEEPEGSSRIMTDIEAATWAEYRAHGERVVRFVHLRIGTGIGCGMIVEGSYVQPPRATSGHADVLIVDDRPDAPRCACGRRGCLEVVVSGRTLSGKTKALGCSPESIRQVIDEAGGWLRRGLVRIVADLEPSVICLGGGVIEAWPDLAPGVKGATRTDSSKSLPPNVRIKFAVLGDDAGIIGAASIARPD
jgi:glucokinase